MANLSDPVSILRGVGSSRQKQLEALGIYTLEDLICHFPRGYEDRTKILPIAQLEVDTPACFQAVVMTSPRTAHIRKGLDLTKVTVADATGRLNLTFFNSRFAAESLQYGESYIFYGMLTGDYAGYGVTNPVFERPEAEGVTTRRILPIYPLTAGLSNALLGKLIQQALAVCDPPEEILPEELRLAYHILPAREAYLAIHAPKTLEQAQQAKKRLVFEEFFVFSAGLSLLRAARHGRQIPPYRNVNLCAFYEVLPFDLTGAQKRAIGEILEDFQRGTPMNRLVQGDVGSGKTMVAAAAAYCAVQNGEQAALMAPTEILAEQHAASLGKLLTPLGVRVGLLTGGMTPKEKRTVRESLEAGELDFVIGTHALISDATHFSRLGLVITDEQHRFGVGQRGRLSEKGQYPHLLVMSATPIPRTLAMLLYGDLDVSILDELPPGRQTVDTFLVGESYRARINAFLRKHVQEGHQCFIVCPAVEENTELGMKSAVAWAQTLEKTVFPDLRVSLIHGQMKSQEKEQVMLAFSRQEADILVATTVIEVGVDVPNATVMVIEDADRFGLSQLHQLRGRVGRGSAKSYCILTTHSRNPETVQRLKALCATNDGFQIAREDLKLRGPGDFFGTRQSGLPVFRAAQLDMDLPLLQQAQQASAQWVEGWGSSDTRETQALRRRVSLLFRRSEGTMN